MVPVLVAGHTSSTPLRDDVLPLKRSLMLTMKVADNPCIGEPLYGTSYNGKGLLHSQGAIYERNVTCVMLSFLQVPPWYQGGPKSLSWS